jgi:hypothetical protein
MIADALLIVVISIITASLGEGIMFLNENYVFLNIA